MPDFELKNKITLAVLGKLAIIVVLWFAFVQGHVIALDSGDVSQHMLAASKDNAK